MAQEAKIEKYLCDRVKMLGGEVRKVKWIGRRGAPDRLVMLPEARKHVRHDGPKGTTYTNKLVRAAATIGLNSKRRAKNPSRTKRGSTSACAIWASASKSSTRWKGLIRCWGDSNNGCTKG